MNLSTCETNSTDKCDDVQRRLVEPRTGDPAPRSREVLNPRVTWSLVRGASHPCCGSAPPTSDPPSRYSCCDDADPLKRSGLEDRCGWTVRPRGRCGVATTFRSLAATAIPRDHKSAQDRHASSTGPTSDTSEIEVTHLRQWHQPLGSPKNHPSQPLLRRKELDLQFFGSAWERQKQKSPPVGGLFVCKCG